MAGRWREKGTGTLTLFGFGLSSGSSTSTVPSETDDTDSSCPSAKGRLAILLLSVSLLSVICERGFSSMNYIKNEFRSVLSQENLNACMSIALCKHTPDIFPFFHCLD